MGGVANTVGRIGSGVLTLGGSELARNNLPRNSVINKALQAPGTILTGGANAASVFGGGAPNPYVGGPFSLDPNQVAGDQNAITGLGQKQYQDTLGAIDTNSAAQQQYAGDTMNRMLPGIYEDMNSKHLLNSSATGQEIGRQASYLSQDVASQRAQQMQQALTGRQGFETGALQRNLSLEDMIQNANISKSIGAAFTPQQPTGKQNFGTVAQGVGALAPIGALAMGGPAAGAAAQYVQSGANKGQKYGKS